MDDFCNCNCDAQDLISIEHYLANNLRLEPMQDINSVHYIMLYMGATLIGPVWEGEKAPREKDFTRVNKTLGIVPGLVERMTQHSQC